MILPSQERKTTAVVGGAMMPYMPTQLSQTLHSLAMAVLLVSTALVAQPAMAGCSPYVGRAVINEIFRQSQGGNTDAFTEIKRLDSSITSAEYNSWNVRLCRNGGSCMTASISQATKNLPWMLLDENDIPHTYYNIAGGMDALLTDASGDIIDYVSVANWSSDSSYLTACSYFYDTTANEAMDNTFDVAREPDGIGDWTHSAGASGGTSDNTSNDGNTSGPAISVPAAISVDQGDTASITVTLSSAAPSGGVTVTFQLRDGTAYAGTDYTPPATLSVYFPRWFTTRTIDISTLLTENSTDTVFYLLLTGSDKGYITDQMTTVTIRSPLLARYYMEESGWNGSAGEVEDSAAYGYDGTARNGLTTAVTTPAITGDPGTCRYGDFDGTDDYIELPGFPNLTGDFTIMAWIRPNTHPGGQQDWRIFADDQNNSGGYALSLHDGGVGRLRFFSRGVRPVSLDSPAVVSANTWSHVAIVHVAATDRRYIYHNGVQVAVDSDWGGYSGSWGTDAGVATIGGEADGTAEGIARWRFDGLIDEVRVYSKPLTAAQIAQLMNTTHPCTAVATPLHHIRVQHPSGSGVTCNATELTVIACADDTCATPYTDGVSGNLTATGTPAVNWPAGSTFAIPLGSSSVTVPVQVTQAGTVVFGIDNVTPVPTDGAAECNFGTPACTFTAADAGFLFAVPDHAAETTQTFTVSAVKKDDNSLACVPAFASRTDVPVTFACAYSNPVSGYVPVRMGQGGTGTPLAADANSMCSAGGQTLTLDFDPSGVAQDVRLIYADVGVLTLTATFSGAAGSSEENLVMTGSDSFVVRPHDFALSNISCADGTANPAAADADGAAFCRAGQSFNVTVTAHNAAGDITPNFGRESTPESVALATTLVAPVGGSNPVLAGSFGSFGEDCAGGPATAGTACGTFTWPEVGIITLTPSVGDGDYLGAGNVTGTASGNVGRFYPASFAVSHTPVVACGGAFTYAGLNGSKAGQPFSVTGTITARNVGGATTANYAGAFAKLGTGEVTAVPMQGAAAAAGVLTWNVDSLTFAAGEGDMNATARYAFTAEGGPQAMHLRVMADDGEASGEENDSGKAVEYRLGRLRLQNAYGAELADIAVPMQAEYYDAGGYYRRNDADNCTALTLAGHLELRNPQTAGGSWQSGDTTMTVGGGSTAALPINSPLVSGDAGLVFTAPGAGNTGYVDIRTSLATDHPWLGHAWNCDATAPNEACGRVNFGLYQGSPRHIYLRERY
ncbi:MAG: hypothetical protein Kow0096_12060 [Thiohalomonadaceae bacterium]